MTDSPWATLRVRSWHAHSHQRQERQKPKCVAGDAEALARPVKADRLERLGCRGAVANDEMIAAQCEGQYEDR